MRKTLVQALLAAFCAILCALSSVGGGGMNRRRILASVGSHTPTAKDYVQDGLIAMWDGIENAGWGVHDPNATTWKDLAGTRDATLTEHGSFGDDCLICRRFNEIDSAGAMNDGPNFGKGPSGNQYTVGISTVEVVFRLLSTGSTSNSTKGPMIIFNPRSQNVSARFGKLCFPYASSTTAYKKCTFYSSSDAQSCIDFSEKLRVKTSLASVSPGGVVIEANYMNGLETPFVSYPGSTGRNSSTSFTLFGGMIGSYGADCDIYAVRCYNRVLTSDEIAANYAIDKARFNLT